MAEIIENKEPEPVSIGKKVLLALLCVLCPIAGLIIFCSKSNKFEATNKLTNWISSIVGGLVIASYVGLYIARIIDGSTMIGAINIRGLLFFVTLYGVVSFTAFLLFQSLFYRNQTNKEFSKDVVHYRLPRWIAIIGVTILSIVLFYLFDAVINSIPRGIYFKDKVYGWSSKTPTITFYAIFIVTGALLALLFANNKAKAEGYTRDYFDSLFFIAFPFGIIGARIWWVISEWNRELAGTHTFFDIIDVRSGGLAIQGGVILGALAGIWFMCEFHREMKLSLAMDLIIPGILIAQAIGRFGNFTNVEVYGDVANASNWWFLPQIVIKQMQLRDGSFHVPLFLIEAFANTIGYFVIVYGLGNRWAKKYTVTGDQAYAYFIWYGIVRIIMEPLRDSTFIMGTSVIMSAVFIGVGTLAIVVNHIVGWYKKKPSWGEYKNRQYTKMNELAEKFEALPKWTRVVLALPVINSFAYSYYRFVKGHFLSGVLNIFLGGTIFWIFDIFMVLMDKTPFYTRPLLVVEENV